MVFKLWVLFFFFVYLILSKSLLSSGYIVPVTLGALRGDVSKPFGLRTTPPWDRVASVRSSPNESSLDNDTSSSVSSL